MNFADRDPVLRPLLDSILSADDRARVEPFLAELGEVAAGELDDLARSAEVNPPTLRQYAPDGSRIDEVVYHPHYDAMCEIAYGRFGLAAMSHREGVLGWPTRVPHVVKYALSYLFVQSEFGLACPLSMTDSAARVLRLFDEANYGPEIAALSSTDMDMLATGAMFMTEKQAGTDIGRTETVAEERDGEWILNGTKWFCSNVSADVILTLARVPGQGEGTRGLGMFSVTRWRSDGSRNGIRINRLKDKLGTRSMASGEVQLVDAVARPVGDLSRGFLQMAEMLNVSRLSNAMRASALMRRAVREAIDHTRQREVFGTPLFDQPLMRVTLLPLMLHAEAALGIVLEAAAQLDRSDAGDDHGHQLVRVLTPLAKHTVCKRARQVTGEAMETRGGNGYIEDWVNARLLRDSHLGSIWEGSSNVIALDLMRTMRKYAGHRTVAREYTRRLGALTDADVRPAADDLVDRWARLEQRGDRIVEIDAARGQAAMGAYADDVSQAVMASLLLEQAEAEIRAGRGHRKLTVAHTWLRILDGDRLVDAPALDVLEQIADGGEVEPDVARAAYAGAQEVERV